MSRFLLGLILLAPSLHAETLEEYGTRVLEQIIGDLGPGGAVLVARGDQVLFERAHGMADLELDVPMATENIFRLASVTKQFTAAAILKLADEGKLSLDDPLSKFLPDYPLGERVVTVHQLLNHTSGIKSYTDIEGYMASNVRKDVTLEQLIDVFEDEPFDFEPGAERRYNNSGYVLLGAIIEERTGMSYGDYLKQAFFEPLGMSGSSYSDQSAIIEHRAEGYLFDLTSETVKNAPFLSMTQPAAAGGLLSTVGDLHVWQQALHGGELISEENYQRMITPEADIPGQLPEYAYGLMAGTVRGEQAIFHGGGIFGFQTYTLYLPEHDVDVSVLLNFTHPQIGAEDIARRLAAHAIDKPFAEFEAIELSREQLEGYEGTYRIDDDTTRTFVVENGEAFTQRSGSTKSPVFPAGDDIFFYKNSLSYFKVIMDDQGKPAEMQMFAGGEAPPEVATYEGQVVARPSVAVPADILQRYAGDFELAEGFVVTFTVEDGQLHAQATGQPKIALLAESQTLFYPTVVDAEFEFEVGEDGRASKVTLRQAGAVMEGPRTD